ncbi:MAG TPA: TIGR03067 domain-containing protein [Vicinamibacterales bacterium]|nr:TIGR03067 domain-containing protein [Vicinamibacterales bacterium]
MFRTTAFSLLLLLFQAAQTTPPPPADAAKKVFDQLQGSWLAVSLNGQDMPGGLEMALTFTDQKYENWVNGSLDERGTVKIDPSTKPASIDFVITEGTDAGQTQLGLVEVNGDSLILSFARPGNPTRPKTPADAELYAVLRKKK